MLCYITFGLTKAVKILGITYPLVLDSYIGSYVLYFKYNIIFRFIHVDHIKTLAPHGLLYKATKIWP